MTIASIILVLYILYTFIRYNKVECLVNILVLYFLFSTFINMGYFFRIGKIYIQYSQFLMCIIIIFCTFSLKKIIKVKLKKRKNIIIIITIFCATIIVNLLKLLYFNKRILVMPNSISDITVSLMVNAKLNLDTIQKLINLICFILICVFTNCLIDKNIWNKVRDKYIIWGKFMIIIALFEIIYNNVVKNNYLNELFRFIFGTASSQYTDIINRGGIYAIQGLTKEPSALALGFLILAIVLLLSEIKDSKKTFYLIIISFILLFSGSFAGIMCIGVIFVIYSQVLKNRTIIRFMFLILVIIICIIGSINLKFNSIGFEYYLSRLENFIRILKYIKPELSQGDALQKVNEIQYYFNNGGNGGSEYLRLSSIIYNLDLFYQNILFGVGLGTTNSHGAIPAILANIGIIGFGFWGAILLNCKDIMKFKKINILLIIIVTFIFIGDIGFLFSGITLLVTYSISYYN